MNKSVGIYLIGFLVSFGYGLISVPITLQTLTVLFLMFSFAYAWFCARRFITHREFISSMYGLRDVPNQDFRSSQIITVCTGIVENWNTMGSFIVGWGISFGGVVLLNAVDPSTIINQLLLGSAGGLQVCLMLFGILLAKQLDYLESRIGE